MAEILPEDDLELTRRRKRLVFRAWHRGVKEADLIVGSFVEANVHRFGHDELAWFEGLLEEPDQDVLAWIMGARAVPAAFDTPLMHAMQKLDYVSLRA